MNARTAHLVHSVRNLKLFRILLTEHIVVEVENILRCVLTQINSTNGFDGFSDEFNDG